MDLGNLIGLLNTINSAGKNFEETKKNIGGAAENVGNTANNIGNAISSFLNMPLNGKEETGRTSSGPKQLTNTIDFSKADVTEEPKKEVEIEVEDKTEEAPTAKTTSTEEKDNDAVTYTYKPGDTFGQALLNMGLSDVDNLWGGRDDVAYYTNQLRDQGFYGNIPVGATITLKRRKDANAPSASAAKFRVI